MSDNNEVRDPELEAIVKQRSHGRRRFCAWRAAFLAQYPRYYPEVRAERDWECYKFLRCVQDVRPYMWRWSRIKVMQFIEQHQQDSLVFPGVLDSDDKRWPKLEEFIRCIDTLSEARRAREDIASGDEARMERAITQIGGKLAATGARFGPKPGKGRNRSKDPLTEAFGVIRERLLEGGDDIFERAVEEFEGDADDREGLLYALRESGEVFIRAVNYDDDAITFLKLATGEKSRLQRSSIRTKLSKKATKE